MFMMRYFIIGVSRKIEYLMRRDLYDKLLRVDSYFYLKNKTGDVISRCTNDLNDVRTLLGPGVMYIPNSLTRFFLFLPVLFGLNSKLMLIITGLMVALVILIVILLPLLRPLFQKIQEQVGVINNFVWEAVTAITTIKLYHTEPNQEQRFNDLNEEYVKRQMRLVKWRGFLWPFFIFVFSVTELLILYFGGKAVIDQRMSLGELLQFNVMIGYLTFPILSLGWIMSLLQQGISALKRINEIFNYQIAEKPLSIPAKDSVRSLAVNDLTFTYPGANSAALENISLKIDVGKDSFIGITGEIGGGKSTLIHLLTAILPIPEGTIYVDDVDLAKVKEDDAYSLYSLVFQQPYLFSRSIKENIILARHDEVDEEEIGRALELAGMSEDVATFPNGLEQMIGERGISLSGGQKQRLAIARALYKKSPILVLDDALSSVDARTEEKILQHLRELNFFKTIIFISHRISALKNADKICVMKRGKIIETGTHQQLLDKDGYYAKLAMYQQLSMDEENW